jgi:hypothetical protein
MLGHKAVENPRPAAQELRLQLVAGRVMHIEDVHRIRPDGEDDAIGVSLR